MPWAMSRRQAAVASSSVTAGTSSCVHSVSASAAAWGPNGRSSAMTAWPKGKVELK